MLRGGYFSAVTLTFPKFDTRNAVNELVARGREIHALALPVRELVRPAKRRAPKREFLQRAPILALAIACVTGVVAIAAMRKLRRHRVVAQFPANAAGIQAMHDALRRDLDLLAGGVVGDEMKEAWAAFRDRLVRHHDASDELLLPALRSHLTDPADDKHVEAILDEHRAIARELELVEKALASPEGDSGHLIDLLARTVRDHLEHEARSVVPLLEQHLSEAEWREFLNRAA
jgi:hypothetical protein